jgi:type II secretory pathway component PulJ
MSGRRLQGGFSLVELLVALLVTMVIMAGLFGMLIENSRINKSKKMTMEAQANARSTLSLVVQKLRSAGWDPMNAGIPSLTLDPDLSDAVSQIEIFADLDMDGDTDEDREQILLRHQNGQVEWRSSNDVTAPFAVMAVNISNDADGDGTAEPMFVPDATPPTRITVRVTAQSPSRDPMTGEFIRYSVASDVILRKGLE